MASDPMDVLSNWQRCYKASSVVAEMTEPLLTKASRENMHNTINATDKFPETFLQSEKYKKKATEYFGDTICEFFNELSGEELFNCFCEAAKENLTSVEKEYKNAKTLMELIEGKKDGKK